MALGIQGPSLQTEPNSCNNTAPYDVQLAQSCSLVRATREYWAWKPVYLSPRPYFQLYISDRVVIRPPYNAQPVFVAQKPEPSQAFRGSQTFRKLQPRHQCRKSQRKHQSQRFHHNQAASQAFKAERRWATSSTMDAGTLGAIPLETSLIIRGNIYPRRMYVPNCEPRERLESLELEGISNGVTRHC